MQNHFLVVLKQNWFRCFVGLVIYSCFICYKLEAADTPQDVFSPHYLEINRSLAGQTDIESVEFISHKWVNSFVESFYSRLFITTMFDPSLRKSLLDQLSVKDLPLVGYHELGRWDNKLVDYQKFQQIPNLYQLRESFSFGNSLIEFDHILANVVFQERYLLSHSSGGIRKFYDRIKNSFRDIKSNLMLLRNDMEIALKLALLETKEAEEIIKPYMGRVFYVERKGINRAVVGEGSGTVVHIKERKLIITCRHFKPIDSASELEIYFIPSSQLNTEDYFPKQRVLHEPEQVDWGAYHQYLVTDIYLLNSSGMESKITFINSEINYHEGPIHLSADNIKILKHIKDNAENNDIAFMAIKDPETLQNACSYEISEADLKSASAVWAAGYPGGGGIAGRSFAVVEHTQCEIYNAIVEYNDGRLSKPEWHYQIASFPIAHGMSGGGVFLIKGKTPYVLAVLTGIDYECMGALCSTITQSHIDIFG